MQPQVANLQSCAWATGNLEDLSSLLQGLICIELERCLADDEYNLALPDCTSPSVIFKLQLETFGESEQELVLLQATACVVYSAAWLAARSSSWTMTIQIAVMLRPKVKRQLRQTGTKIQTSEPNA